ncbi:hypothetical protein A2U01_0064389, partial [Trifolium medium]|nr:hypothetical protein [Trifolium medium]
MSNCDLGEDGGSGQGGNSDGGEGEEVVVVAMMVVGWDRGCGGQDDNGVGDNCCRSGERSVVIDSQFV